MAPAPAPRAAGAAPLWMSGKAYALYRPLTSAPPPYPDNHTSALFLSGLVLNASVVPRSLHQVIADAQVVVSQLAITGLFAAAHAHLRHRLITGELVLVLCVVLLLVGTAVRYLLGDLADVSAHKLSFAARQTALIVAGCFFLAPVLCTLTRNIASDTVHAWSVALLVAHLYLHDYFFVSSATDRLTGSLSLGAAVLASALLASRLEARPPLPVRDVTDGLSLSSPLLAGLPSVDAFAQVLLSMEIFVLSPYLRRSLKRCLSRAAHTAATAALVLLCVAAIAPLSAMLAGATLGLCAFVGIACPVWLVRVHKYKTQIEGPWDEAKLYI